MRPSNGYPDPRQVGNFLFGMRQGSKKNLLLSELADDLPWNLMPRYPQDETLGQLATRVYQSELRERAEKGDKFAKATLEEGGWNEPS